MRVRGLRALLRALLREYPFYRLYPPGATEFLDCAGRRLLFEKEGVTRSLSSSVHAHVEVEAYTPSHVKACKSKLSLTQSLFFLKY